MRTGMIQKGVLLLGLATLSCVATAQLPDLIVRDVDASGITWQISIPNPDGTVNFTGSVVCRIDNIGAGASPQTNVLVFGDRDGNGIFNPGDVIYGSASVVGIPAGSSTLVTVPVAGTARFWNEVLYAIVDPDNSVVEANEENNTGNSAFRCSVSRLPRFDPRVKWHWGRTVLPQTLPEFREVLCTPMVADINLDGIPEVIFVAGNGNTSSDATQSVLRVIRGDTGAEVWTDTTRRYSRLAHVAVGNLDDDPFLEIVVLLKGTTYSGTIVAYNHDGTVKWETASSYSGSGGAATLADINGDGKAEVIYGNVVINGQDGTQLWVGQGTRGAAGHGPISVVADIDLDGVLEIIAGPTVYNPDGTIKWRNTSVLDGLVAVANLDSDPEAEIVISGTSTLYCLEHDGTIKWTLAGNYYGPPVIANVDDDPTPEILVVGCNALYVVEPDGTLKWSRSVRDPSCRTGATVFDFEGDGQFEVVYRDEEYLRVFRGSDGEVLMQERSTSTTWTEYPVVADVDADGSADIVVGQCVRNQQLNEIGVLVIESATRSWLPTRRIWNQHAYSITNINDNGTIPRYVVPNWLLGYNSFRANAPGPGQPDAPAPDLTGYLWRECQNGRLTARVGNGGSASSPAGVLVQFYNGNPNAGGLLIGQTSLPQLLPNEYVDISIQWNVPILGATVYLVVLPASDAGGNVIECDVDNNQHSRCFLPSDVNGDGRVDRLDLQEVRRAFGRPWVNPRADINCDGRVNDADLLIVLVTQGRICSQ